MKTSAECGHIAHLDAHAAVITIEVESVPTPFTTHTILVLDCSGSMAGSIAELKRDAQSYVNERPEHEFVSVIIFSGHNQSRMIAGPIQCNAEGRKLVANAIESGVRVLDTTVFSEPLELTLASVGFIPLNNVRNCAVLFTDGCAVPTKWTVTEELGRVKKVARRLDEARIITSVIGYGVHYDDDFLAELLEAAGNVGVYRHISEIEDFSKAMHEIDQVFRDSRPVNVDVCITPDKGKILEVFKVEPGLTQVGKDGRVVSRGTFHDRVQVFMQCTELATEFTVKGRINGMAVLMKVGAEPLAEESAKKFVFLQAALAFIVDNDSELAAEYLRGIGADGMSERAASAYTVREKRETADMFRHFFADRKFIGAGLKPTGPNHCALNVLRTLIEDPTNVVYIPKGAYKRSGELTSDPRVMHSPHNRTLKVTGYASHASRMNFSMRAKKDVKILPEDGKGSPVDAKVWRTYNVVLDGNLHLPELEAVLSADSFTKLQQAGVITAGTKYKANKPCAIDLRGVKMISGAWANPATLGFVELLREEAELEAEQKALNARRKATGSISAGSGTGIDEESGLYHEKAKKVEAAQKEFYSAMCIEIRLMKYKAGDYKAAAATLTYQQADERVKQIRQRLIVVRFLVRAQTFAMEAVRQRYDRNGPILWSDGKTTAHGKHEQLASFRGAQLKRVTWSEEITCS